MPLMTPPWSPEQGPVVVIGEPMVEITSVEGDVAKIGIGGDTFNTAVYLKRTGVDVQYMTALGRDSFSQRVASALEEEGIGTDHIYFNPDRAVGLYAIRVDEEGERSFTYWRENSAFRTFFDAPNISEMMAAAAQTPLLYLSGITLSVFNFSDRGHLVHLAKSVRANGGHIGFDTNYRPAGWDSPDTARRAIEEFKPFISVAMPTFDDEHDLYGTPTPDACVAFWEAAGVDEVCVKAGAKGARLSDGQWVMPSETLKPIDTTGAGDSFNAAYLGSRLLGDSPPQAAATANQLAGAVVMNRGAIIPSAHMPKLR